METGELRNSAKENSEKIQVNNLLTKELTCSATNKINGLNNWTLAFFVIFCSNFIIDNYISYGIIKDPIDMTFDFMEFMEANWWCFAVMFLCYFVQIILCFLNEKLLSIEFLSERLGMALHLFISLLLFNLCSILCLVYKFNPVAGIVSMTHVFLMSVKFWGYAYKNKKFREIYRRNIAQNLDVNGKINSEGEEIVKNTIKYPDNVTLKNVFQFMACTGSCLYKISGPTRKPRNLKKILARLTFAIFIYYAAALVIYQYILPETNKVVSYINTGQYLNIFGSVLKLALPVNIVWLAYYYFYCFGFYLPVFGWFWGTEDVVVGLDWWNSENTTVFWAKWNYQVHMWLKENFFLPTLQMGYSKRTAAFVVGCVTGILHEYLICIPCRCCYGLATVSMLAQIPLADFTASVQRRYGSKWGNLLVWTSLIFGQTLCMILIYYNYLQLR